ncbi:MAG: RluA family pseudouridine synthase [Pirellulaceae bacterium]
MTKAPEIIHETEDWLAVNKPGGLLTQAPSGIDSMEVRVKRYLATQQSTPGKVYLGVPHRLDRPATGVMVFAKHKKAARRLAEQFQNRQVEKTYWTLVSGRVEPDSETWIDWMRKIPDEARSEICGENDEGSQRAVLHYRVVRPIADGSLLEIKLETGRSHQIRLQAASRGHPVFGDSLYGSDIAFGPQTNDTRLRQIALHARQLEIVDPATREPVILEAEVPVDWKKFEP